MGKSEIEKLQRVWAERFKKGWDGGDDPLFFQFLKKYRDKERLKVLDIGFGGGRHIIPLVKMGFSVYGIELTRTALLITKKKLQGEELKADLRVGDYHELPYPDGFFDLVVSIQVFQFNDWQGAETSFGEASRVLKKGGLLFLRVKASSAPVPEGNVLLADKGKTFTTPEQITAHFYTLAEIKHLTKAHSLRIVGKPTDSENRKSGNIARGQWNVVLRKI